MELSGYLTKNHAGRALDAGSRRRYFVSEGYHVQYFETEKRKTRHGRFDLRNVTAVRGGASSTPIPHEAERVRSAPSSRRSSSTSASTATAKPRRR